MSLPIFMTVEAAVEYALQRLRERRRIFKEQGLHDPVDWLEPSILARMLGLEYELVPTMHLADRRGSDVPVGLLDLNRRAVVVSEHRGLSAARFTGAHELGHYLYHQGRYRKHWERVYDPTRRRSQAEREADTFAGRFLVPKKLLRARIEANFRVERNFCSLPISVNDNVLFHLCGGAFEPDPDNLELEYALAKTHTNFDGEHIVPLYEQFKVSVTAIAIELRRLRVLSYPMTSYRADL